ncbi:hypothetical protein PCE1_001655 [Barthelona sp. PCE]
MRNEYIYQRDAHHDYPDSACCIVSETLMIVNPFDKSLPGIHCNYFLKGIRSVAQPEVEVFNRCCLNKETYNSCFWASTKEGCTIPPPQDGNRWRLTFYFFQFPSFNRFSEIKLGFPNEEVFALSPHAFLFVHFGQKSLIRRDYSDDYSSYEDFALVIADDYHGCDLWLVSGASDPLFPGGVCMKSGIYFFENDRFFPADNIYGGFDNLSGAIIGMGSTMYAVFQDSLFELPIIIDEYISGAHFFAFGISSTFTHFVLGYRGKYITEQGTVPMDHRFPYRGWTLAETFDYTSDYCYGSRIFAIKRDMIRDYVPIDRSNVLLRAYLVPKAIKVLDENTLFVKGSDFPVIFFLDRHEIWTVPIVYGQDVDVSIDSMQDFSGMNPISFKVHNGKYAAIVTLEDGSASEQVFETGVSKSHLSSKDYFLLHEIDTIYINCVPFRPQFRFSSPCIVKDKLFVRLLDAFNTYVYRIVDNVPQFIARIEGWYQFSQYSDRVGVRTDHIGSGIALFDDNYAILTFVRLAHNMLNLCGDCTVYNRHSTANHIDFEAKDVTKHTFTCYNEMTGYNNVVYRCSYEDNLRGRVSITRRDLIRMEERTEVVDFIDFACSSKIIHFEGTNPLPED